MSAVARDAQAERLATATAAAQEEIGRAHV